MTSYIIKHHDDDGEWFFKCRGMWSDSYGDAFHFRSQDAAQREADAADERLAKMGHRPRCRVIQFRPTGGAS